MALINKKLEFDTLKINGGYDSDAHARSVNVPIYQSAAFEFGDEARGERLFTNRELGFLYSRVGNPTVDALEQRIAALHGANAAISFASGMAAITNTLLQVGIGGSILTSYHLYGGTVDSFKKVYKDYGIRIDFSKNIYDPAKLEEDIKEDTKAIYVETVSNPTTDVADLEALAELAHKHNIPLIVDNTFATPVNCRPIEFGCDIVTHSTTKYIDGHASSVGGAIIDSGNFDWMANKEKFPGLTTPDESYHGLTYATKFGKAAYITKATAQLMRDFGCIQSPQNAYYIQLGLESLPVRMARHCSNAQKVAEFLASDDRIAWVNYPGLETDKNHALAKKYCPKGTCGVLCFGVKGGREASIRFMDSLKLATIATHVADSKTLLLHPASHTHRQLTDEQLAEAGIPADLIRFSVGLEDPDDIINDIKQALDKIG